MRKFLVAQFVSLYACMRPLISALQARIFTVKAGRHGQVSFTKYQLLYAGTRSRKLMGSHFTSLIYLNQLTS